MPRSESPGVRDDGLRDSHRRRARRDAAAIRADIDLDQYGDADACGTRRGTDTGDGGNVVGQHGHRGLLRHCREARELRRSDDLVGDEHVPDAGGDERLRLADLLATDADGAALELRERDLRALVRLAVRAQRDTRAAHRVGHQVEVALERVEVDDQRRSVDVVDGIAGSGGRASCITRIVTRGLSSDQALRGRRVRRRGAHGPCARCSRVRTGPISARRRRPRRAGRRRRARS